MGGVSVALRQMLPDYHPLLLAIPMPVPHEHIRTPLVIEPPLPLYSQRRSVAMHQDVPLCPLQNVLQITLLSLMRQPRWHHLRPAD